MTRTKSISGLFLSLFILTLSSVTLAAQELANYVGTGSNPRIILQRGENGEKWGPVNRIDYRAKAEIPFSNDPSKDWSIWNIKDDKGNYFGTLTLHSNGSQVKFGKYEGGQGRWLEGIELKPEGNIWGFTVKAIHDSTPPPPPPSPINYTQSAEDTLKIINAFITIKQQKLGTDKYTYLLPNVLPLNQNKLNEEVSAGDWQLHFSYDASRFSLFAGAYCLTNTSGKLCDKAFLTKFMEAIKATSKDGRINPNGYWAYTTKNGQDGSAVNPGGYLVKPALVGPIAVAELAASGSQSSYYKMLLNELGNYKIKDHTPDTAKQQDFLGSSDPYFNGSLNLISQILMIGDGGFDLEKFKGKELGNYVSYKEFQGNYTIWNSPAFMADFKVTDENGRPYDASRVIFSMNTAPHASEDNWADAGAAPTVSEGMAYGLFIAYAANDQKAFDKLLNFILFTSRVHGCGGVDSGRCIRKTNYLMPWLVDKTGRPFHYTIAGGHLTNGSATDADINIVWALGLASERWKTGSSTLMGSDNYAQIAKKMIAEIATYDFNQNVSFFDQGKYTVFSPGSQWGEGGKNLMYPGYFAPRALELMDKLK